MVCHATPRIPPCLPPGIRSTSQLSQHFPALAALLLLNSPHKPLHHRETTAARHQAKAPTRRPSGIPTSMSTASYPCNWDYIQPGHSTLGKSGNADVANRHAAWMHAGQLRRKAGVLQDTCSICAVTCMVESEGTGEGNWANGGREGIWKFEMGLGGREVKLLPCVCLLRGQRGQAV